MLPGKIKLLHVFAVVILLTATASYTPAEVQPQPAKAAVVNGVAISKGEFDGEVLKTEQALLGFGKPLTCGQISSVQKEVLERLIHREVLYQDVIKTGIKPDETAVDAEIKALKHQFSSETEYKKTLSNKGLSEDVLRSRIGKNNVIQQYIERLSKMTTVADEEVIAYYEGHLDLFKQPLQVRVGHIFISADPKWNAARNKEARRKAELILTEIKQGRDFADVAREQSDGPTRMNGGDLGYIRNGQLDRKLESAVFDLKAGEMSEIVETDYGFHIFKVTDRKPETVLPYEEVREKIRQFLREEKARQDAELRARKLRATSAVEILLSREQSDNNNL